MRPSLVPLALIAALATAPALPGLAQTPSTPSGPAQTQEAATRTAQKGTTDCPPAASQAMPATQQGNAADATAPSNPASTGWSGGLGGSMEGTNPSGATVHTKTWHPPTARGLDLTGRPEPASLC